MPSLQTPVQQGFKAAYIHALLSKNNLQDMCTLEDVHLHWGWEHQMGFQDNWIVQMLYLPCY
jgi:hypothetical protein